MGNRRIVRKPPSGILHGVDLLSTAGRALVGVPSGTTLTTVTAQPGSGITQVAKKYGIPSGQAFWGVQGGSTFTNCEFDATVVVQGDSVNFNNCWFKNGTIALSSADDVTLYRCYGSGGSDMSHIASDNGSVVLNTVMTECLFELPISGAGDHTDGLQIRGINGLNATRCAWDLGPWYQVGGEDVLNAAMFPDGSLYGHKNMLFKDCYFNGGGYTVYLRPGPANNAVTDNNRYRNLYIGSDWHYGKYQLDSGGTPVEWSAYDYPAMTAITL